MLFTVRTLGMDTVYNTIGPGWPVLNLDFAYIYKKSLG